jgi:hypothetical protein
MTGHRTIVSLGILCALAFGAFAAPNASASLGTTAFTCKQLGGTEHQFSKAHCKPADDVGGEFAHVAITDDTATEIEVTNEQTKNETKEARHSVLKETIAGVELELDAAVVSGEGTMENKKDAISGEHYAEGSATLTYSGVTAVKPVGKGCKVFAETAEKTHGAEGVINAKAKATTKGQGMFTKLEPKEGVTFATFFIECEKGKEVPAVEGTWEITGSLKCPTDGATVICSHTEVTTQNTLKGKGSKAGFDAAITLNAVEAETCGPIYTPLSATTSETP